MMKYIILTVLCTIEIFASLLKTPILEVNGNQAVIAADNVKVGMSGFIVHKLAPDHSIIVNALSVVDVDEANNKATIQLEKFTMFVNNNLPSFTITAQKGDEAILAFGYHRGLIIAPNEKIYYRLKNAMRGEVVAHPDIFATFLSSQGHPSPLKKDFSSFCQNLSIGLVFFYIDQKLYTTDCQNFSILDVQDAPLQQTSTQLPFYSRVEKIRANWFGEGSDEIENYEEYYYQLLLESNPNNAKFLPKKQGK